MLKTAARNSAITSKIEEHVRNFLAPLWQDGERRKNIGLAISGGVDSMALATICQRIMQPRALKGFIVDHTLRLESATEALKVADELIRLDITPEILQLDWSAEADPQTVSNFESVARKLRYQAIGKACYSSGIRDLLVAHHADDQAETVLLRMLSGYTGSGLGGISPRAGIPACSGIYGVDRSGEPRRRECGMDIEGGGVILHRPLLPFAKEDLIDLCRDARTKWFEDPTNALPGVTLRNTLRYLQKDGNLPVALRRERLLGVVAKVQRKKMDIEGWARRLFDAMHMTLDLRFGILTFTRDESFTTGTANEDDSYHVKATLLRRLLNLVSPATHISLQDLDIAIDYVFHDSSEAHNEEKPVVIAGVRIQQSAVSDNAANTCTFSLHRSLPPKNQAPDLDLKPAVSHDRTSRSWKTEPEWQLWDSRYWIRVRQQRGPWHPTTRFAMRHLTPERLGKLRKSLRVGQETSLRSALVGASTHLRAVLPVLLVTKSDDEEEEEQVLGLPTLKWVHPNLEPNKWDWEVRYKNIEFEQTERHKLIS